MDITKQIDLVESRKAINIPPKKQYVTPHNTFFDSEEYAKQLEQTNELRQAIRDARKLRK